MNEDRSRDDGHPRFDVGLDETQHGQWEPGPLMPGTEFVPNLTMPAPTVPNPTAAYVPVSSPPATPDPAPPLAKVPTDAAVPFIVRHDTEQNGLARNAVVCAILAWMGAGIFLVLPVDPGTFLFTLVVSVVGFRYGVRSHNAAISGLCTNGRMGRVGGALCVGAFLAVLAALVAQL